MLMGKFSTLCVSVDFWGDQRFTSNQAPWEYVQFAVK